jgi:hypothetical protein
LGCYTSAGEITLIQGWNWYAGSDATAVGSTQHDFETAVIHELGHALGLGHNTNAGSVMNPALATGTVERALVTADLGIPDPAAGADALHAAVEVGRVSNPSYQEVGRDLFFAFAGTALDRFPVAAGSETRAERSGGVGDPRRAGIDAVFARVNEQPIFAAPSQQVADNPLFTAEKLDDYLPADFSWQE